MVTDPDTGNSAPAAVVDGEAIWVRLPRELLQGAPAHAPIGAGAGATAAEEEPIAEPGRYLGLDGDSSRLELRLTPEAVSGDIFRGAASTERWLASFRSEPEQVLAPQAAIAVTAIGHDGKRASGGLVLRPQDGKLDLALTFSAPLDQLPLNTPVRARMRRDGPFLRHIALELMTERGVSPAVAVDHGGASIHFREALARAGVALEDRGPTDIPSEPPEDGWSEKELHTLMSDFAQTNLSRPDLSVRLLWLSKSNRNNLLGVMFDDEDALPRQGCAVFADAIRVMTKPGQRDRKLLQIAVHEIGHALNLAHRFDADVGQKDSLSFLNYDWKYRGGGRAPEFWELFDFSFDPDELGFLHHGSWGSLVPGGDRFRSATYWHEGTYGYPALPDEEGAALSLEILPPLAGPVFHFAQPVILGLRLHNGTGRNVDLPANLLDPKSGGLHISITRETGRVEDPIRFYPITHRCIDQGQSETVTLGPGNTMESNVNLSFGGGGFPFAEPGNYRVEATLAIGEGASGRAAPLRLRVSMPQTRREENLALDLLDTKAGRCLALGGSGAYDDTAARLLGIAENLRAKSGMARDPIAVNIFRSLGFHYRRAYPRLRNGKIVLEGADREQAKRCSSALDKTALRIFDPVTARETGEYLKGISAVEGSSVNKA